MGIRSLVSFGLLALPVGVTLGLLIGLDAWRQSTGQTPLFVDNGVTISTYCQKSYGITPQSKMEQYTLNPNQWGWTEGTPGNLCMNVTAFHNGSYPGNTAPEFSVTWYYPQGPVTQPVHAYPNIILDNGVETVLPVQISTAQSIMIGAHWTYGVGSQSAVATDSGAVASVALNANVAFDMFLDPSATNAQKSTSAKYEVMVWLARFGSSTDPIGFAQGALTTQVINSTTFSLYYGQNNQGQYVLTWVASATQENFYGDIAPLITSLSSVPSIQYPASTDYLGYLGFGTEAYYSQQNVTFSVPNLSMQIVT